LLGRVYSFYCPPSPTSSDLRHVLASGLGPKLWASFIGLQIILACIACGLSFVSEALSHNLHAYIAVVTASVICLVAAVCLTHGVGGKWKYYKTRWNFIQPGVGGMYFVMLQALSWSLFGIALLVFASNIVFSLCALYFCGFDMGSVLLDPPSLVSGGLSGLLAEMLLIMSLLVYDEPQTEGKCHATKTGQLAECRTAPFKVNNTSNQSSLFFHGVRARTENEMWTATASPNMLGLPVLAIRARRAFTSWFCYNIPIVNIVIIVFLWNMRETIPYLCLGSWMLFYLVYFPTYALGSTAGGPSLTGSRYSPNFLSILHEDLSKYFAFTVARSQKKAFDPDSNYVFGYHPHGIIPLGYVNFKCIP